MQKSTMSSSLSIVIVLLVVWLVVVPQTTNALVPPQIPAPPATPATGAAVNVDVNVQELLELVKTRQARTSTFDKAKFLAESARYLIPEENTCIWLSTFYIMHGYVLCCLRLVPHMSKHMQGEPHMGLFPTCCVSEEGLGVTDL